MIVPPSSLRVVDLFKSFIYILFPSLFSFLIILFPSLFAFLIVFFSSLFPFLVVLVYIIQQSLIESIFYHSQIISQLSHVVHRKDKIRRLYWRRKDRLGPYLQG